LGWSLKSVVLDFIEFLYLRIKKKSTMHWNILSPRVQTDVNWQYQLKTGS
jgi:hypothetical protein